VYQAQLCPGPAQNLGAQKLLLLVTLLLNHPLPTWRFRQEPRGQKEIGPQPSSSKGEQQHEAERALPPSLAAGTQHCTHAAPLFFKGPCATMSRLRVPTSLLLEGSILLLSPWQGCRGLGSAAGAAGRLTPLSQPLDFKATGEKNPSGIHVVPEHLRQFRPRQQTLLVLHDRWETGAQSNGYRLLEAKARDWGKDMASEILI